MGRQYFLNRDVYLISGPNGGQTFGEAINLSNNGADSYNQEISVSGNNVYVVWQDSQKNSQDNSNISFISSNDGGSSFGDVVSLSDNAGKSSFPKTSSYQDDVYIAWNIDSDDKSTVGANNSNDGIFFVKSTDNGSSFNEEIRLTAEEKPGEVQITANDNNVYIVWGYPDPSTNNRDTSLLTNESINSNIPGDGIYFTKSVDNGNSYYQAIFY